MVKRVVRKALDRPKPVVRLQSRETEREQPKLRKKESKIMTNNTRTIETVNAEISGHVAAINRLKAELKELTKAIPSSFEVKVVEYVSANPGCSRADIAIGLSVLADQALTNCLKGLRDSGALTSEGERRGMKYSVPLGM